MFHFIYYLHIDSTGPTDRLHVWWRAMLCKLCRKCVTWVSLGITPSSPSQPPPLPPPTTSWPSERMSCMHNCHRCSSQAVLKLLESVMTASQFPRSHHWINWAVICPTPDTLDLLLASSIWQCTGLCTLSHNAASITASRNFTFNWSGVMTF